MGSFVPEANASNDQAVKQAAADDASPYAELCFVDKRLQLDTFSSTDYRFLQHATYLKYKLAQA